MTFKFGFKTSFGHLQDTLARCLVCINKKSLGHLINVFLPTGPSQQTINCSKLATETQNKVWKLFKFKNEDITTTSMTSFSCLHCCLWTYFTFCSNCWLWADQYLLSSYRKVKAFNNRSDIYTLLWSIYA